MREPFENVPPDDPIEATRRSMRTVLPRRFYETAATAAVADGYAVRLDDKPVHTPARRVLAAPTLALAEAIAAEWQEQKDVIDPAKMPLTRLANAIIDGVADAPLPVAEEIAKYLASDLLFYRAASPLGLVESQAHHWDPILGLGAPRARRRFQVGRGDRLCRAARCRACRRARRYPAGAVAARCRACRHDAHRFGADRACHGARRALGRRRLAGGACR